MQIESLKRLTMRVSVIALTTETNISVLDRLYKNQATMDTYIKWLADS